MWKGGREGGKERGKGKKGEGRQEESQAAHLACGLSQSLGGAQ